MEARDAPWLRPDVRGSLPPMSDRTGGCQCGRVRYRIVGAPLVLAVCHCTECQRHSGSAFGMSMFMKREQLVIESGTLKCFERSSDSGRPVRNHFCPECGTRIYTEPTRAPGMANLKPGTLDETTDLKPGLHAWTRSRQTWFALPPGVHQEEGQPGPYREPTK